MCDQQSFRSACAYAQSDQSLCLSLEYPMSVKLLTEHHLRFLSLRGDCTDSSECTLVKIPNCWKFHDYINMTRYIFNSQLELVSNPHTCEELVSNTHTCEQELRQRRDKRPFAKTVGASLSNLEWMNIHYCA